MTQVSGSISLEMGKVVRDTARTVMTDLVSEFRPADSDQEESVLDVVADAVAERVVLRLDRDLGGVLAEVRTALLRVEELVRAEAERAGRMEPTPLSVMGPDGQPLYVMGGQVQGGGGGAPGGGSQGAVGVGSRVTEGGLLGTLVRCPECGGHGLLHRPDEVPDGPAPAEPEPLAGAAHLDYAEDRAAARRADERLAQARRDGAEDSWYEEPS